MEKALHVWVKGRVQGVFFRDSTRREAQKLGLGGWVRNLPDGRVEALFVGGQDDCMQALKYVSHGPPQAYVTDVEHRWDELPDDIPPDFKIRF